VETFDERKFRELLLYVASRCERHLFCGSTKLNKILFYADFLAFARLGQPITSAEYEGRQYGPVPRQGRQVQADMQASGDLAVQKKFDLERLIALRDPDLDTFSAKEIAIVDEVIDALIDHSADRVSGLPHGFLGWKAAWRKYEATGRFATIPYGTAFVDNPRLDEFDQAHAVALAEKYGWKV
jgi:uncharacterized phage-associated protein